jgi:hypothetical protein
MFMESSLFRAWNPALDQALKPCNGFATTRNAALSAHLLTQTA